MDIAINHRATQARFVSADDTDKLTRLFAGRGSASRVVTIPPGDYHLDGCTPIPLRSHTHVNAAGAHFHLPPTLKDRARVVLFQGEDLEDFSWTGGHFSGHVFDPTRPDNPWPPNANTRPILVTTSQAGNTRNLSFTAINAQGVAGAVITVQGKEDPHDEKRISRRAHRIMIKNCRFENCGKFMWDYGYLWQITVWPDDHRPAEREHAARYFRHDLVHGPLRIESGDDRIWFDNTTPLPLTPRNEGPEALRGHHWICLFGDSLPANIVRGRQYAVIESAPDYVRIAEKIDAPPLVFAGTAGPNVKLIANLFEAHLALFSPVGAGPGKGAFDLVGCQGVTVSNSSFSALGDMMHIQKCRDIHFVGNRITGSRMGAFFLAEFCENALVEENFVDGTNGSRVMSVEKSCARVTVRNNVFVNGGRGSWINQPADFILTGNVFRNNTTKCEPAANRGRRSFLNGDFEQWAELYFTTYEPGARYGPVVIRDNTFECGRHAAHAISFEPGGRDLTIEHNSFTGHMRDIAPLRGCANVRLNDNPGLVPASLS